MSLSILEGRLKHAIPEEYHKDIEKEFAKYEMETSRLSDEIDEIGQATLTQREIARSNTTNQYGEDGLTVVELQCIKGVAMKNGLDDWLSYVDSSLSYEENMNIIKEQSETTMKQGGKKWI